MRRTLATVSMALTIAVTAAQAQTAAEDSTAIRATAMD
jgi:hypothetical protein